MDGSGIVRLPAGARAQAGPIGYVLLLGMILMGTTAIVTIGGAALTDTQDRADIQRTEKSMTLFDSRAAMVALGEATVQSVSFGGNSGSFETRPDAGHLAIKHVNHSGAGGTEEIFNQSLGSVVQEIGRTEIAYQGGGVWRLSPDSETRMVSPPEFHYRGQTLTLPVVQLTGDRASGGGSTRADISAGTQARKIFPNESTTYPSGRSYRNPVENGTVFVEVHGRYYEGWATYFRQRTTGNVTVFDSNRTARVELISLGGAPGVFGIPPVGESIDLGGIGSNHPYDDFEVNLTMGKNKNNAHYSFYAIEGNKEIELHVHVDGNPKCNAGTPSTPVHLSTYYYDGDGSREYETWEMNKSVDPSTTSAMDWSCNADDDPVLEVNFLSEDIEMTYDEVGKRGDVDPGIDDPNCGTSTGVTRGNKYAFNDHMEDCDGDGWTLLDTSVWDQHDPEVSWEGSTRTYAEGGSANETLANVTNHYMSLMGTDVSLISKHGPGSSTPIDTGASTGEINYRTSDSAKFITFLHVTENEIEVDFN